MRFSVRLLAPGALLCGAACSSESIAGTTAVPLPVTSPVLSALELTVEPAADRVSRGNTIRVTVRVVNRADTTVRVAGSGTCGVRLQVRDASGALAEPSRSEVCTSDCRGYVFAPGQAFVREAAFASRVWSNDAQREVTLTRGEYQLFGVVDGDVGTCGGPEARAASAPARVRVL